MAKKSKSRASRKPAAARTSHARPAPAAPRTTGKTTSRPTSVAILSIIHFAFGLLFVLVGLFMLVLGVSATGFPIMGGVLGIFGAFVGILMLIFGALDLFAGWGLWHMRNYGRILASIGAVISLAGFPLGTIFGLIVLYWLWVRHGNEFH